MRRVFATVGTTSFDDFVRSLCSRPFLVAMAESSAGARGDEREDCWSLDLAIQYGRGTSPRAFLPPSLLLDAPAHESDDGAGAAVLSVPVPRGTTTTGGGRGGAAGAEAPAGGGTARRREVRLRWYRFRPSLSSEMESADVILTHAGAGTLLEALDIASSAKPKVIHAVINSTLMHNHQLELAEELERRGHLRVTRECASEWTAEEGAARFWETTIGAFSPAPFVGGASEGESNFQEAVDSLMGFPPQENAHGLRKKTR